ncbi:hypothetical protein AVEN_186024-1 [Araneus ventricosus]|uniref:Histone H2A n=1 Tax=Araneus ventricosus TaxID=182803 RepID=A0A4Y2JF73_ARAVE|nr:hypothetical protein AVEN_186024-1 [Araneus ventricosus]
MSNQKTSKSEKSGLIFPVSRIKTMLKVQKVADRITDKAAVYLTAVVEYLSLEILEISLTTVEAERLPEIQPYHVNIALKKDQDFVKPFVRAIVPKSKFITINEVESLKSSRNNS